MVEKKRQRRPCLGENPGFCGQMTGRLSPIEIAESQVAAFIKGG
jgi:hypothetical protein